MSERSEAPLTPLRLVLDFGETVEVDGSSLYDPTDEAAVPAVVLRLPPHRAAYFGQVFDTYTVVSRLVGADMDVAERGPSWALEQAASAAGFVDEVTRRGRPRRVTSRSRLAAGAALRGAGDFDDITMIAVIDAAARWIEEPDGNKYAFALLGAVTDEAAQSRTYAELIGRGPANA